MRPAGQVLDTRSVEVARGEVQPGIPRVGPHLLLDEAHALDPVGPVEVGYQAQAGEDVAHGHGRARLVLVLLQHQDLRVEASRGKARGQPGLGVRAVLATQPPQQPHRERPARDDAPVAVGDRLLDAHLRSPGASNRSATSSASWRSRLEATTQVGQSAQVLDQQQPQRDGYRPQLPEGERLAGLVGAHVARQQVWVEQAVGVRDVGPHDAEDPRVAGEETGAELGQLAEVVARQVLSNLAHLGLHDVEVVDDPFGGRGDAPLVVDVVEDLVVCRGERGSVLLEPLEAGTRPGGPCGSRSGCRPTTGRAARTAPPRRSPSGSVPGRSRARGCGGASGHASAASQGRSRS